MADGAFFNWVEVSLRLRVTVGAYIALGTFAVFFLRYRLPSDWSAADIPLPVSPAAGQAPAEPETDQVEDPIPA